MNKWLKKLWIRGTDSKEVPVTKDYILVSPFLFLQECLCLAEDFYIEKETAFYLVFSFSYLLSPRLRYHIIETDVHPASCAPAN